MASAPRPVLCQIKSDKPASQRLEPPLPVHKVCRVPDIINVTSTPPGSGTENGKKTLLQPRLCTLRSYGSDRVGVMIKSSTGSDDVHRMTSPFFATLSDYIESSKKSQDFEIISGRLAMIVFAGTVIMETVTGNSLFRKADLQGIAEAAGVCLGAITFAAFFAWFSSARNRVGRIFAIKCNTIIDSLIDQIVDGLFYDSDLGDWSDDL